jgi:tetratricopeptide (TPR) repeat protein
VPLHDLLWEARAHWDDAARLARIGRQLHERNRLAPAVAVLERAVELDPKVSDDAWVFLAYSHFRDFRSDEGLDTLRRGAEATGSDLVRSALANFLEDGDEKTMLLERLRASGGPAVKAELEALDLRRGDVAALDRIRALHEAHPDDTHVRDILGGTTLVARRMGRDDYDLHEAGLPLAEAKIAQHPDEVTGYTLKIQMLEAEEDHDGVLAATSEALARFPDEETILQMRAQAFEKKGDTERAAHWYARAIGAKPSFAGARRDLAKLLERQGRLDRAEELFREIPEANPGYPLGPMSLALFLARRERWDEAETVTLETWPRLPDWAKRAIRSHPDAAPLLRRPALESLS